jgi:PadR family transcriptional regulator, regulatory protein PadR
VIKSLDVIQGTLDLIILKALALESGHGWGISDRIREMSNDVFKIGQGSLYPALHRFEKRGWVTSYWKPSKNNRLARYYQLTAAGRHALAQEIESWRFYAKAVDSVITTE